MIDHGSTKPAHPVLARLRCWFQDSFLMIAILALAMLLAIGFFYLTADRDRETVSQAVVGAAGSADNAARSIGDAAGRAADRLQKTR